MAVTLTGWLGTGAINPNSCGINIHNGDSVGTPSGGTGTAWLDCTFTANSLMECLDAFLVGGTVAGVTIPAHGWERWDMNAATGKYVYRAACLPDYLGASTGYKYLQIDVTTSGQLRCRLARGWDNSTHSGTDLITTSADSVHMRLPAFSGGVFSQDGILKVAATARYFIPFGVVGANVGDYNYGYPLAFCEITRDYDYGYNATDNFFMIYSQAPLASVVAASAGSSPRFNNIPNAIITPCIAYGFSNYFYSGAAASAPFYGMFGPQYQDYRTGKSWASSICACYDNTLANGGWSHLGTVCGLFAVQRNVGSALGTDDVSLKLATKAKFGSTVHYIDSADGVEEACWLFGSTTAYASRLAVRK